MSVEMKTCILVHRGSDLHNTCIFVVTHPGSAILLWSLHPALSSVPFADHGMGCKQLWHSKSASVHRHHVMQTLLVQDSVIEHER